MVRDCVGWWCGVPMKEVGVVAVTCDGACVVVFSAFFSVLVKGSAQFES